jgi:DNA-binding response OmpR family regulator
VGGPEGGKEGASELPILLLVEDNPDMRQYIKGHLDHIARIFEASDGENGFHLAMAELPDLIVSDVMMPAMDGFELCQKLKSNELTAHIPVILLTARGSGESKMEGLEYGADGYLTKPVKGSELRLRVRNIFEQQQKQKDHILAHISSPSGGQPGPTSGPPVNPFLQRALNIVEGQMSDAGFGPEELARELTISRGHLNRKLHGLIGHRTVDFIRTIRLKRAAELLRRGDANVSEVASQVGFNHLSYFAQCFKEQFGQSPSEYTPE